MTRTGRPLSPRVPGTFAAKLTRLRLAAKLSQDSAGSLLGRHRTIIQRWEAGEIEPDALTQAGALATLSKSRKTRK